MNQTWKASDKKRIEEICCHLLDTNGSGRETESWNLSTHVPRVQQKSEGGAFQGPWSQGIYVIFRSSGEGDRHRGRGSWWTPSCLLCSLYFSDCKTETNTKERLGGGVLKHLKGQGITFLHPNLKAFLTYIYIIVYVANIKHSTIKLKDAGELPETLKLQGISLPWNSNSLF